MMGVLIMAEYIKREAVLRAVQGQRSPCRSPAQNRMLDCLKAAVIRISAADVAPVVHGRWEMRPTGMATDTGPEYKAYCTICNEPNKQYRPPFCPHCGAKMDGGGDHEAD